ncbi:MAG: ThiF family adenylyltransferase, partial [Zhongshania sp.]|nr:ThiF family adenylyltransferase [Zhongshania sp.]
NKGGKNKNLFEGFVGHHYLSNKPSERTPKNYYELVTHYHSLFRAEAQLIDINADGRTGKVRPNRDPDSPFHYPDTASSRAGITGISERLKGQKIGIIGLGGTGAYALDLLAKMPVSEIHCFDDDVFEAHNAFRAPGAASLEEVNAGQPKVNYLHEMYRVFHHGIVPHAMRIDEQSLDLFGVLDFVFICIDDGPSRLLITRYLAEIGVPFIDVGIGMDVRELPEGGERLSATCRVTLGASGRTDHLDRCLDYSSPTEGDVYASNIQSAPINSLNASLAVVRWLQYVGAMWDDHSPYQLLLNASFMSLVRSEGEES